MSNLSPDSYCRKQPFVAPQRFGHIVLYRMNDIVILLYNAMVMLRSSKYVMDVFRSHFTEVD